MVREQHCAKRAAKVMSRDSALASGSIKVDMYDDLDRVIPFHLEMRVLKA